MPAQDWIRLVEQLVQVAPALCSLDGMLSSEEHRKSIPLRPQATERVVVLRASVEHIPKRKDIIHNRVRTHPNHLGV